MLTREELAHLAIRVLNQQKRYFTSRLRGDLQVSKKLEAQLRKEAQDIIDNSSMLDIFQEPEAAGIPEPPVTVMLACSRERVPESAVEFLGVSEDIQGRDVLTFRCPRCGETHTALRQG